MLAVGKSDYNREQSPLRARTAVGPTRHSGLQTSGGAHPQDRVRASLAGGGEYLLKFGALGTWTGTPHPSPASTSPQPHPTPT